MATATDKAGKADEKQPEKVRFNVNGEWVEMDVTDSKMLAQMRNLHDKQQETVHSKARETFRKVVSGLINEEITEELEAALSGQAILFRMGKGDDADDDVQLMKSSMITLRKRAAPKDADSK